MWLVEIAATDPEAAPLEYRALATADVVIYDRVLASSVAKFLPLCGYAEPAGASDGASERCIRLVSDGWSVARLIFPASLSNRERCDRVRRLAERWLALRTPPNQPASLFVNAGGGTYQRSRAEVEHLRGGTIGECHLEKTSTLTIVFDAIEAGAGPLFSFISANGLAG